MAAKTCQVTIINRGNRSITGENIRNYIADRHDGAALGEFSQEYYDVVVDFCGYGRGDILYLIEHLKVKFDQYIFVSTCDVYKRGTMVPMDENGQLELRDFGGPAGDYISGKVALEQELKQAAKDYGFVWTSVRPVFIYGPDNYAPREAMYFKWITEAGQIIHPSDSDGEFQMVYVDDVSRIILKCCKATPVYNRAVNVCGPKYYTYDQWSDSLKLATGIDVQRIPLSVEEINGRGIPLPFPLTKEESNWYITNIPEYASEYISLDEGLRKTYEWYMKANGKQ